MERRTFLHASVRAVGGLAAGTPATLTLQDTVPGVRVPCAVASLAEQLHPTR